MKVKSGFAAFAKSKVPLKHPTNKPETCPRKILFEVLGKLLPNGFRVGERVFYVSTSAFNPNRVYGTVVDHDNPIANQRINVWAKWDNSPHQKGWVPLNTVFRAEE